MFSCHSTSLPQKKAIIFIPVVVLFLQTGIPLLIRHTRKSSDAGSARYHPAFVTCLAELVKGISAFIMLCRSVKRSSQGLRRPQAIARSSQKIISASWHSRGLLLPAMLYFASNLAAMHALAHIRSYIFTAIMNSRITFAAMFSTCILKKKINREQWRAVIIITCVATILCFADAELGNDFEGFELTDGSWGILIALSAAILSAAGGSLMEKYLIPSSPIGAPAGPGSSLSLQDDDDDVECPSEPTKHAVTPPLSSMTLLWERQGVLSLFSSLFACLHILFFLRPVLAEGRLLEGWTGTTTTLVLLQALHGIMVALMIYTHGFVVRLILGAISICLCIVVEGLAFSESVTLPEVLCILVVILASDMYVTASQQSASGSLDKPPKAQRVFSKK